METPEEESGDKLNEDKMFGKVNELVFSIKNNQCGKNEENKIPGEEIPKMSISSSKESSATVHHCLKGFTWKQEEKQSNASILFKKIKEQLRRKEKLYSKELEIKQPLGPTLQSQSREIRTIRNNLKQVEEERNGTQSQNARDLPDRLLNNHLWKQKEIEATTSKVNQSSELFDHHEKDLLSKNHNLQHEIAMLKLELDTVKIQAQEKESRYTKENEVLKEKNDELLNKLKLNEETLTKIQYEYNKQLNVLMIKNGKLKSKLENEKQNRDRVGKDIESCLCCLTSAISDHEQSQISKQNPEYSFQQEPDEWIPLKDKVNCDLSMLRDNNDFFYQQLFQAESKANNLENELHCLQDSLTEKALILESTQRDLNQVKYQVKELELINKIINEKLHKYMSKKEDLRQRIDQVQNENMLLQQQLENAPKIVIVKKQLVRNIHVHFGDPFDKLHADREKQVLMAEERNKELINEYNHLREQICKYEKEKTENEGTIRELQQELADCLNKQSMFEASLKVFSHYGNDLEDKKQLQKEVDQIESKLQESEEQNIQSNQSTNELEDHMQKLFTLCEITIKVVIEGFHSIQKTLAKLYTLFSWHSVKSLLIPQPCK
ncbi:ankyrin repeat domain-containing protein 26-like isoform X3 [Monodelphis domestica]|uniref:ankyrin repeat domain-containing protein 26-like isoform X3 n=1 Tax=Monodelphis domestica TaxID=13616 RepID=UPI0024E2107A|nr:ankyrin repeat domain-containing protein 26-like isoform X3 [Monodelphis domestica]